MGFFEGRWRLVGPTRKLVFRWYKHVKFFAVANHVENILAHDGRLPNDADVRRFRG